MQDVLFDTGLKEYRMPGGILRFNPRDPNLYQRFFESASQVAALEDKLVADAEALQRDSKDEKDLPQRLLNLMAVADKEVKEILNGVFGGGNDFDALLNGVNVMGVGNNGERILTNLFEALRPILAQSAEECAASLAESARKEAEADRAQREQKAQNT